MDIKPLILVKFLYSSLSGGYRRLYEVLRLGKSEGIDYIVLTDTESCRNAVEIFPNFMEILQEYKVYKCDSQRRENLNFGLKQVATFKGIIHLASFISRVARKEDADLIVSPNERTQDVLACFLASIFCSKPWTAIFQPTTDLLQPSCSIGSITPLNILSHISQKTSAKNMSFLSKIGLGIDLLCLLRTSEKTILLTVSGSVVEDFKSLNPRIKFLTITPGNGIDLSKISGQLPEAFDYHGIFFARLIPEKGLFDLVKIWKLVVKKLPNAKLAVCGIPENAEIVKGFLEEISRHNLDGNIEFLGHQDETKLFGDVKRSYLTVYPSYVDSFSLVTLESLACGTPVVAYDIPAIRYNFGKCEAVFRSPVGDKADMARNIQFLLGNKDLRTKFSKEARKYSTNYDWRNVIKTEKKAYFKVIEYFRSREN